MCDRPGLDFSFSGLKTFALNTWQQCQRRGRRRTSPLRHRAGVPAGRGGDFDHQVQASPETGGMKRLVIAGGVSANKALRVSLEKMLGDMKGDVFYARPEFCTDNGAMIAFAGCQRLQAGQTGKSGNQRAGALADGAVVGAVMSGVHGRHLKMPFAPGKQVA
jgi:N6-L-threonylcarbamoyladenine synthase